MPASGIGALVRPAARLASCTLRSKRAATGTPGLALRAATLRGMSLALRSMWGFHSPRQECARWT